MAEEAKTRLCVRRAVHFVQLEAGPSPRRDGRAPPNSGLPLEVGPRSHGHVAFRPQTHGLETPVGVAEMVTAGGKGTGVRRERRASPVFCCLWRKSTLLFWEIFGNLIETV